MEQIKKEKSDFIKTKIKELREKIARSCTEFETKKFQYDDICPDPYPLKPKLNNKRIIRQQGCFLLFGINGEKTSQTNVNEKWIRKDLNNRKFIIPNTAKKHILNELKNFGISHNTLFPELESQAKEILEKYKK